MIHPNSALTQSSSALQTKADAEAAVRLINIIEKRLDLVAGADGSGYGPLSPSKQKHHSKRTIDSALASNNNSNNNINNNNNNGDNSANGPGAGGFMRTASEKSLNSTGKAADTNSNSSTGNSNSNSNSANIVALRSLAREPASSSSNQASMSSINTEVRAAYTGNNAG